jgi:hydroxypyruvate reductase
VIDSRRFLHQLFEGAVDAARPDRVLAPFLPPPPAGRTLVVGAGKAAAAMARAVETHWPGPLEGVVVTRYGHGVACERVRVIEASHPVPDAQGVAAADEMLRLAATLGPDDLMLCLISGGGSALLVAPPDGVPLDDKRALTRDLLRSGASIDEINTVRKHLSRVKGGRLAAAAHPAAVVTLAISDVPGDDPAVIASGPTVADPTTYADARRVLARRAITPSPAIAACLAAAADESPKPGDPRLARAKMRIVARPLASLEAAAAIARAAGVAPLILGDAIEGEAREAGRALAGIARAVAEHGMPLAAPAVLLSGGETTVTVRGAAGRGGRNKEFLLAAAIQLGFGAAFAGLACDTDGIDGTEDDAGALFDAGTLERARARGIDPVAMLDGNDAWGLFHASDDLIVTGPTRTNVNDFRALLILPTARGVPADAP